MIRRAFLCALLCTSTLIAACGGGGGGSSSPTPAPVPVVQRSDLLFGYFGTCPTCQQETSGHTNLLFEAPDWFGLQVTIDDMTRQQSPTILFTPRDERRLRDLLASLQNANVLRYVVALYPQDEPDNAGMSEAEVVAMVSLQRQIAAQFVELNTVSIAVIYGSQGHNTPGISAFDWVGFDDYDRGAGVLDSEWAAFRSRVRVDQRLILVPGGASPWRTDPVSFLAYANSDPQVVAIVPFIWFDNAGGAGQGIRSNGMKHSYCITGTAIKGVSPSICN